MGRALARKHNGVLLLAGHGCQRPQRDKAAGDLGVRVGQIVADFGLHRRGQRAGVGQQAAGRRVRLGLAEGGVGVGHGGILHVPPQFGVQLPCNGQCGVAVAAFQRAAQHLAPEQALIPFRRGGQVQGLAHREFHLAGGDLLNARGPESSLDAQRSLAVDLPGQDSGGFRQEHAGDVQHHRVAGGQRDAAFGREGLFLHRRAGPAVQHAGALLDAAVRQRGDQLQLVHHLYRHAQRVGAPQVDAVLADGAAVDVFQLAGNGGRACLVAAFGQVGGLFKREFLLDAVQLCAGLVRLVVDGAAQVALPLPLGGGGVVLQKHRLHQAFDDLEHRRQIIRDQELGLHRQLQPCLPPAAVGGDGVFEHLQFHSVHAPFCGSVMCQSAEPCRVGHLAFSAARLPRFLVHLYAGTKQNRHPAPGKVARDALDARVMQGKKQPGLLRGSAGDLCIRLILL